MNLKSSIIYFLFFLTSCKEKERSPFFVNDLDEKIVSDWVMKNTNQYDFILRKFNRSIDDSCWVYRFKKPNYFTCFFYTKNSPGLDCGNVLRSNDVYSNWNADNSNGFITIDNVLEAVSAYKRSKIRYTVLEYKPGTLSFFKNKIIAEEEK